MAHIALLFVQQMGNIIQITKSTNMDSLENPSSAKTNTQSSPK